GKSADLKGPRPYDRRLLLPAGEAIMHGRRKGLSENFGSVENLVSGMGRRLARSFSDPNLTRVNWSGLTNALPEILRGMVSQVVAAVKTLNRTISGTTFA